DIAQSFGFANDGSKMVDKAGVFHLDTCFVAGTQVHRIKSWKESAVIEKWDSPGSEKLELTSIENIKVGDTVVSWNERTGQLENKRVTELFVHEVPQLFFLELDNEEELRTTWNHPFRRRTSDSDLATSEWTKVEELKVNDEVLKSDGTWARVTGIFHYNVEPTKVYNFEVEDNHTYIVGGDAESSNSGYVVHNYEGSYDKQVRAIKSSVKELIGRDGLFGFGAEKPYSGEAKELLGRLNEYDTKDRTLKNERLQLKGDAEMLKAQKGLLGERNDTFLSMVRSSNSDGLDGIKELRKALRNVDPKQGLNKTEMAAVATWMKGATGVDGNQLGMFKTGGMSGLAKDVAAKSLLLRAARDAGGAGEVAHLNEKLAANQEQQRQKAIDHEKVGADLAVLITKDYANLKEMASQKHHDDPKVAMMLATEGTTKSQLSTAYISNEGKQIHATNEIKYEKLKQFGHDDKLVGGLLTARNQIAEGESNRLKAAQEKSVSDPEYQRLLKQHEDSKQSYEALKPSVENALRIAPEGDKGVRELLKTLKSFKETMNSSQQGMEKRMLAIADTVPNEQAYAGRIHMQTTQDVSRDTRYAKNLEEIAKLKTQKANDITNSTVGTVCSYCVDTSHADTKIAALEKQNADIFNGYKKANEKNISEYQKMLGADGLKKLDQFMTTQLNAKIEAKFPEAYAQMKDGKFPENGIFSENNVTPKETVAEKQVGPNLFNPDSQVARLVNEGSPGAHRNPNGMPYQSEIDSSIAQKEKDGPPSKKMSEATYKEALENPFKRNPDISTLNEKEMNDLGLAMTKPALYNQGENNAMSVQGAVILDVIRKGGKENFQMDPVLKSQSEQVTNDYRKNVTNLKEQLRDGNITLEQYNSKLENVETAYNKSDAIVRSREFNKIKDWIFSNKKTQQLGNEISSAICRMNTNYVQGYLNGETKMSFGEYMVNKFRNADVKFNGNSAPVYDMNGFRGFETSLVNGTDSSGNRISNDFEGRHIDPKTGKMVGMVNPIPVTQLENTIKNLKPGAYVQIYWDTNITDKDKKTGKILGKPGPNHFSLAIVGADGKLYDLNNNGTRNTNGSAKEIFYKDLINPIYGIYYSPKNRK
ncbi:polymorphic toxin-type HINT domain-containing protein, partial [Leptospira adleri]